MNKKFENLTLYVCGFTREHLKWLKYISSSHYHLVNEMKLWENRMDKIWYQSPISQFLNILWLIPLKESVMFVLYTMIARATLMAWTSSLQDFHPSESLSSKVNGLLYFICHHFSLHFQIIGREDHDYVFYHLSFSITCGVGDMLGCRQYADLS